MEMFAYKITRDFGFAPNPFHGICTLATCKPHIRKAAKQGDLVVGCGSSKNRLAGRLIYLMRVGGKCSFQEYWDEPRFSAKKPNFKSSRDRAYGDNIYHRADCGEWTQERSHHTFDDGSFNAENCDQDTSADEAALGPVSWQGFDFSAASGVLGRAMTRGHRIYSAAYIMPAPSLGHERKHDNHLALLSAMMEDALPARLRRARSLQEVFEQILAYPGLGRFLAFQYSIDLNYSSLLEFSEGDFVVAGPGALDGIAKCFADSASLNPEQVIFEMADRQQREFPRLGLPFSGLLGRPLQPIDCQNIFCEISKYARVAHPKIRGTSDRTRIKQSFKQSERPISTPALPPRWGLAVPARPVPKPIERQPDLFRLSA